MSSFSEGSTDSNVRKELQKSLKALDTQRKALEAEADAIVSELNAVPPGGGTPMGIDTPLVDDEGYPRSDIDIYRARHLRSRFNEIRTDHKALMLKVENGLKKLTLFANPSKSEKDSAEHKARLAPKPKPKFDPISGKWVVSNWNGTIAGVSDGHLRSFKEIPSNLAKMKISSGEQQTSQTSTPIIPPQPTSLPIQNRDVSSTETLELIPFALVDGVFTDSPASAAGLKEGDMIVKFGTAIYSNHRQLRAIAEMVPLAASENRDIPLVILRRKHGQHYEEVNDKGSPVRLKIRPRPWSGRGLIGCHIKPIQ